MKLHNKIFLPQGLTGPKDIDKRLSTFKHICVDEARNALIAEMNFTRLEFINKFTTDGSALKEKLIVAKDRSSSIG